MVGSPRRTTGGGGAPEGAAHAPRPHHHRARDPRPPSRGPPRPSCPTARPHHARPVRLHRRSLSPSAPILLYLALPLPSLLPPSAHRLCNHGEETLESEQPRTYPQSSTLLRCNRRPSSSSSRRGDTGPSFSAGMVPRDAVNAALGRSLVQGSVMNQKCDKKVPKKIHKSEREKRKRGTQNDLFNELGAMLEPDRQNIGKACVLGDTTRTLKDLVSQVESLRKENITLKNESHYVVLERNELRDDNSMLRSEIVELQDKLRMRQQSNPLWSQDSTRSALAVSYPRSRVFPVQHSPHLPDITATTLSLQPVVTEQCYAAPPRELQLFPEASSASTEDSELSRDQGISNSITRPQARYPTPAVMSSPVNQFPILPRMGEEQQYSSGTSEEHVLHRV